MKRTIIKYPVLIAFSVFFSGIAVPALCGESPPRLGKAALKDVIAAMTLEEKASLVVGAGMSSSFLMQVGAFTEADVENNTATYQAQTPTLKKTEDLVSGAGGETHAVSRLGINAMVLADGPAGLRINPECEY